MARTSFLTLRIVLLTSSKETFTISELNLEKHQLQSTKVNKILILVKYQMENHQEQDQDKVKLIQSWTGQ